MRKQGDGYVIRSEESITLMTPYGGLSIYLLTIADPSRSFRMTINVLYKDHIIKEYSACS